MNLDGKIIKIFDTNVVSDKFKKREFVVEYAENPKYPESILLQVVQDKCDILDNYSEGDEVEVEFNLKGKEWNGKYFNSLEAWKIDKRSGGNGRDSQNPSSDSEDDLPF